MPEPLLATLAVGQLARRCSLPFRAGGSFTASKVADAQAMQESADALMGAVLCGANFIMHGSGWLEGALTMGYEKFILDCDHLGMMHVFLQGLRLDANAFAMDAFREVGPGKHFLGCAHTLANYQTAFYEAELADSSSFEQWRDAGAQDAQTRANARWKQKLRDYEPPALDPAVDEALQAFIAKRKASMPDMWH